MSNTDLQTAKKDLEFDIESAINLIVKKFNADHKVAVSHIEVSAVDTTSLSTDSYKTYIHEVSVNIEV